MSCPYINSTRHIHNSLAKPGLLYLDRLTRPTFRLHQARLSGHRELSDATPDPEDMFLQSSQYFAASIH